LAFAIKATSRSLTRAQLKLPNGPARGLMGELNWLVTQKALSCGVILINTGSFIRMIKAAFQNVSAVI
jgi:hypothetical protein